MQMYIIIDIGQLTIILREKIFTYIINRNVNTRKISAQ
jgi:hypothetical protein